MFYLEMLIDVQLAKKLYGFFQTEIYHLLQRGHLDIILRQFSTCEFVVFTAVKNGVFLVMAPCSRI
jgi:hypothetical protein